MGLLELCLGGQLPLGGVERRLWRDEPALKGSRALGVPSRQMLNALAGLGACSASGWRARHCQQLVRNFWSLQQLGRNEVRVSGPNKKSRREENEVRLPEWMTKE